ncbi:MAG: tRNA (adenosine(37)-N6)-dimethylallyltransferase MiaA [Angelakisella sp.]|jgi:tRNA dimethylallyltransferase|nr:tRNA (adenosine(37)-N6)-dimethylallyltransferase MiaA [Angelakisella sp.]
MTEKRPLLAVAGPTASGKTALSVRLAKALDGEVVSADSMQMYRGMDIGTAKPAKEEMAGIPHHLIDVLDPWETFSVADYAAMARPLILEIGGRGKLPILTGGTGLYLDAIVKHIQFSPMPSDEGLRRELRELAQREGTGALFAILRDCDPEIAATLHENNLGRVIRAIEVYRLTGIPISEHNRRSRAVPPPYRVCFLGLTCQDRQKLYQRINLRVDRMLEAGLVEEARRLFSGVVSPTAAQAIGYKELRDYLEGRESLTEAAERIKKESRNYAKRQLTWFRREESIRWLETDTFPDEEALFQKALEIVREELLGEGKKG